jgi:hypothetical protein
MLHDCGMPPRVTSHSTNRNRVPKDATDMNAACHDTLFASPSFLVCGLDVELVEYLDNREALEVGDRKLEPEVDKPER